MNIGVYVSFLISDFAFFKYPEVQFLGHTVALVLIFWGTSILFSIAAAPIYIP